MDNSYCFHSINNFYLMFNSFICYTIKHTMPCCICDIASSPFFSSTKISSINKPVRFFFFFNHSFLCIDYNSSWTFSNSSPRHTPSRKLTHCFWRSLSKHSCYFLITAPITSFYCICEVKIFIITLTFCPIC